MWQRIQAMASMAPSCFVLSSIAPNQGSTCSRNTFMVSIVAILLSTPTPRAAMWRTAVYGCCRQVHRRGSCSINCRYRDNRRLAVISNVHAVWSKTFLKAVRVHTTEMSSWDMAPAVTSSTCREFTSSWAIESPCFNNWLESATNTDTKGEG